MNKSVIVMIFAVVLVSYMAHPGYSQLAKSNATLENGVWHTTVGKQVQVTTDVTNGQNRAQPFAYIVQIENQDGVVYSIVDCRNA